MKKLSIFFRNRYSFLFFLGLVFFAGNGVYQVYLKPTEIVSMIYEGEAGTIGSTWKRYQEEFLVFSTDYVSPQALAAIAQVESAGRIFVSPPWRWQWKLDWKHLYKPMSSAVGLMQITEGHFEANKNYCIREGTISKKCGWRPWRSRLFPGDAIEISSVYIHRTIDSIVRSSKRKLSNRRKVELAAIIHLCGAEKGESFVRNDFSYSGVESCGTHNTRRYVKRVLNGANALH